MKEPNVYSFFDECYVYYGDYAKEIERLEDKILKLETDVSIYKNLSNLRKDRINKAREYCKNDDNFELADLYSQHIADRIQEELLEILEGDDKE